MISFPDFGSRMMITDALLTEYALPFCMIPLMAFMAFIVYRLGVDAKARKWGMFVLFLGLMVGVVGFSSKFVIKAILDTRII